MNIIEAEDMVKGLPDQVLFQYAQNPPPTIPQFLAVSEVQRRQDMRQRFQAQQQQEKGTVKDQILQGIGGTGMAPEMSSPPPMAPSMPQGGPPPVAAFRGGMMPYGMAMGRQVPYRMQEGRQAPTEQEIREALRTLPRNRTPRQQEIVDSAKVTEKYNPFLSGIYRQFYGEPTLDLSGAPSAAPAVPKPVAAAPAVAPVSPAAPRPAPVVEAGIPAADMALKSAAPPAAPATPPAPPAAPPMAAAVAPPAAPSVAPPAATPTVPGFTDPTAQAYDSLLSRLPQTYQAVSKLMPPVGGFNAAELERFKPTQADYINPDVARQREELLAQLRAQGEARRKEDMAAAERAMKESEAPIQQASEEARRAAIASTLMRLGAGVAAGKGAEGLASASESVEQIMGRAREQAAAERRASRQEFRAAEREATRAERSVADVAFQMQASNITANESAQRDFVRDQKSFAQWAYGQMRDAGREARQAQGDAIKLSIGITQSIDQAVRDALKTRAVSENQYTETFGTVFKDVLKEIKDTDWGIDDEGNPIVPTAEQLLDAAGKQTDAVLSKRGIISPSLVITVTSPKDLEALKSGQRYRGPDGIVRVKP